VNEPGHVFSALDEYTFVDSAVKNIVISEFSLIEDNLFIELFNRGTTSVQSNGLKLSPVLVRANITYDIPANQYFVICSNTTTNLIYNKTVCNTTFSGKLKRTSVLTLLDVLGNTLQMISIPKLLVIPPTKTYIQKNFTDNSTGNWIASFYDGGSPGQSEPIHCEFTLWNGWSECNACNGTQNRTRSIQTMPQFRGKSCDSAKLIEVINCTLNCSTPIVSNSTATNVSSDSTTSTETTTSSVATTSTETTTSSSITPSNSTNSSTVVHSEENSSQNCNFFNFSKSGLFCLGFVATIILLAVILIVIILVIIVMVIGVKKCANSVKSKAVEFGSPGVRRY